MTSSRAPSTGSPPPFSHSPKFRTRMRPSHLLPALFFGGLILGYTLSAPAHLRLPTALSRAPLSAPARLAPPARGHLGGTLLSQGLSHVAFHAPATKLLLARLLGGPSRSVGVVGVEWGAEATLFAQRGYTVHAFEPMPAFHAALAKRIAINAARAAEGVEQKWDVRLHQIAAGAESSGSMDVRYQGRSTRVQRGRIDAYVRGELDVLSVDIQGGELDVLRGAKGLLGPDGARSLWVEVFPCNARALGVLQLLDKDYAIFDFMPWGLPLERRGGGVNETMSLDKHSSWFGDSGGRRPAEFKRYYDWFCRASHRRFAWIQSDILAVRRDLLTPKMMARLATLSHDILEESLRSQKV